MFNRIGFFLLVLALGVTLPGAARPAPGHGGGGGGGTAMGRLRTIGFEIGLMSQYADGNDSVPGTIDATFARSGSKSLKCDSGAGVQPKATLLFHTASPNELPAIGETRYYRAYYFFQDLPTTNVTIFLTESNISLSLAADGTLTGFFGTTNLGSAATKITTGSWFRLEVAYSVKAAPATDTFELRINGNSEVAFTGTMGTAWAAAGTTSFGWVTTSPGTNKVLWVDDIAVNSSVGTDQNSWPGEGKIVCLRPTSDNARSGWTAGAGGTTNLFDAVDNSPPAGLQVATNTSQIKDLVSSITDNYDANMTTYTDAGIGATDTITLVQGLVEVGELSVTGGAKSGAIAIVSNPVGAAEATFVYSQNVGVIGAVWPQGWNGVWSTPSYNPSVTLGTAPVLRVGKRTASVREVDCDCMALYVEYVSAVAAAAAPRLALLGVGR